MFLQSVIAAWTCRVVTCISALTLFTAAPARAEVKPWPAAFRAEQTPVSDGTQCVRVGGSGPTVVLLHGFGDTGDMWVPLAEVLVKNHTVIVPDLRAVWGCRPIPRMVIKKSRRHLISP